MIVLGIDVGVSGAAAAIDGVGSSAIHDLPITEDDFGKRLDARSFIHMLRALVPASDAGVIVLENVHVMRVAGRQMSHSTETTLVGMRFAIQAAADIARIRVHLVRPQAWKAHFGIKADKNGAQARQVATALYPERASELGRVKDHNRAEALLIAHFGRQAFA